MAKEGSSSGPDDDVDEAESLPAQTGPLVRVIVRCQTAVSSFWARYASLIKTALLVLVVLAYFAYFAYAMYYRFGDEGSIRLLWVTCLVVGVMALKLAIAVWRRCELPEPSEWGIVAKTVRRRRHVINR